ncbi:hypothetical protein SeMB42_g02651 [Synchytrium endobioticum]|uniref:Uncharacterized protein n=1 Tax=Synchytrium endobioticum TaxID=286115 RepID=A0A507DDE8_9FUNG|nr:hypothetical protein SeMB42_g02651 [Synchytrium endobioticum]
MENYLIQKPIHVDPTVTTNFLHPIGYSETRRGSKPRTYSETGEAAYRTTESCIPVNRPMPTSNAPIEFEDDVDGMLPD